MNPITRSYEVHIDRTYSDFNQKLKSYWMVPVPMTVGPEGQGCLLPLDCPEEREEDAYEQSTPPQGQYLLPIDKGD